MSYPKIEDETFQRKINRKYKRYTIPRRKRTFRQICYPKEFKLQIPQQFVGAYIHPKTPYKGLLIFHRIGAGKTCAAVNICEQWVGKRKIVVVVPASLRGNFRDELRSPCPGNAYLKSSERKQLSKLHPSSDEYKEIIKISDNRIDKYYTILSYNKFVELANKKKINLKNSLLVVDEIQNMVSETGSFYSTLYRTIHKAPSNLRIVLLSATPMFDKPVEIALTMNLLRIPFELPTGREFTTTFIKTKHSKDKIYYDAKNLDIFKEQIRGYISYYRGAPPYTFPKAIVRYVKCEMSDFQYSSYLTVLEKEERKLKRQKKHTVFRTGDILKLPSNFFIGVRFISNVAFPNRGVEEKGYKSFIGKYLDWDYLDIYSIKFYMILDKIYRARGKIFIYSNFKDYGGIKSFVKVLKHHGYLDYSKFGEGRKRYAIWSSDTSSKMREEIKQVFNQKSNLNGSKIKIVIGTPSIREGVSLKAVRQVHILEPYWNNSRMEQIIGRAVRYCSHKELDEEKRTVKVYIYLATHPNENTTIDEHIVKIAKQKDKLIKKFELAMKESAVDCTLFKHGNVFKNDPDIECEI